MSLVKESGEGLDTANAYVDVAEADIYWVTERQNFDWEAVEKEAALIKATAYVDGRYRGRWKGTRASAAQALAWPRSGVTDEDGYRLDNDTIPAELKAAICEAALLIGQGNDLAPMVDRSSSLKRERVRVEGAVEREREYADNAPSRPRVTIIDDLLRGLTRSSTNVVLLRA